MADFCQQCSHALSWGDGRDLAGLTSAEDEAQGLFALALCEGCGPIQVDANGRCVSQDCDGEHRQH